MKKKITKTSLLVNISLVIIGMLCIVAASPIIYRTFCKASGYGGYTKVAPESSKILGNRNFSVRFNADVTKEVPWSFYPESKSVTVKSGENKIVFYVARNNSNKSFEGMAVYNVTPHKAGKYFNKVACFCFEKQILTPGEETLLPVSFFIDPEIENDPELRDISTITLSYFFFPYKNGAEPAIPKEMKKFLKS